MTFVFSSTRATQSKKKSSSDETTQVRSRNHSVELEARSHRKHLKKLNTTARDITQRSKNGKNQIVGVKKHISPWHPYVHHDMLPSTPCSVCRPWFVADLNQEVESNWHHYETDRLKLTYFENPKNEQSWVDPGAPSTSTARPNRFRRKIMLCVWRRQRGTIKRYQQWLTDLKRFLLQRRPEYWNRQHKVTFLHGSPSHTVKQVRDMSEALSWKVLPYAIYSPDLAPSN